MKIRCNGRQAVHRDHRPVSRSAGQPVSRSAGQPGTVTVTVTGGPMKPVKSLEPVRLVLVAAGLVFLLTAVSSMFTPGVGAQVFGAVLVAASAAWCFQAARMGLVIDQNGITERSIGRPRRTPWQDVEEVAIHDGRSSDGTDFWLIALRLRDDRELRVQSTASSDRKNVEDVGRRLLALRSAALPREDSVGLTVVPGDPEQKNGKLFGDPVVGPDGVPVAVRLRGPNGVNLNWGAMALPDGILIGLVAAVLIGLGTLVSALVRRLRKKPGYRLTVEIGGPEPRSLTLSFHSRAQAAKHARSLVAAIGEHGAAAVHGTPGTRPGPVATN
ncbi:PH domain-containing protein [Kitasatospora sp. NPDC092948]|uniref:PH domain-containing protein n=1 Tax=Kitasatospora sp. NPDC092948 TaxID=3364088 RepID=UPI0037FFF73A